MAFLTGAVISVMVIFNTELGEATSNSASILVNQAVGIITLSAIMMAFRKNGTVNPKRSKAPWYLWFGGLFGLVVITCNYFSVRATGATIAMAAAVFGQCLAGTVLDITGWMWMERRRISGRRIASLAITAFSIAIMMLFSGEEIRIGYALIAVLAGVITMLQMAYNARFASYKGAFFSARQNVVSGLIGIALFAFITRGEATAEALSALPTLPFLTIVGGGALACVVVVSSNTVIPRLPGAVSSVLMSAGQLLTAAILDWVVYSRLYPSLIIGSVLMLAGLAISWRD